MQQTPKTTKPEKLKPHDSTSKLNKNSNMNVTGKRVELHWKNSMDCKQYSNVILL